MAKIILSKEATQLSTQYYETQSDLHGVSVEAIESGAHFTLEPDKEVEWVTAVQNSNAFLAKIDVDTCESQVVDNIGAEDMDLASGRTDTENEDRQTTNLAGLSNIRYTAETTQHDTHISFREYNNWARRNRKLFQRYISEKRAASKGNDMMKIAWHGERVAKKTDKKANPLGQDVNIGFLHRIKKHFPENYIDGAAESITIGKGGTYESLDAALIAMRAMIPEHLRDGLELYASEEFFVDRDMKMVEKMTITEAGNQSLQKVFTTVAGGTHAETPPFFPEGTLLLTSPKNLAIRTQEGSVHIGMVKNHPRSCEEFYHESNEFFAVKNYAKAVVLVNVKVANEAAESTEG